MKLSIDVRKPFYLSKLNDLHSEPIYKIVSVNDNDLLNICSKYIFPGNLKHCNRKHSMWQYFESIVERWVVDIKLKVWLSVAVVWHDKKKLKTLYVNIFHFVSYNADFIYVPNILHNKAWN